MRTTTASANAIEMSNGGRPYTHGPGVPCGHGKDKNRDTARTLSGIDCPACLRRIRGGFEITWPVAEPPRPVVVKVTPVQKFRVWNKRTAAFDTPDIWLDYDAADKYIVRRARLAMAKAPEGQRGKMKAWVLQCLRVVDADNPTYCQFIQRLFDLRFPHIAAKRSPTPATLFT